MYDEPISSLLDSSEDEGFAKELKVFDFEMSASPSLCLSRSSCKTTSLLLQEIVCFSLSRRQRRTLNAEVRSSASFPHLGDSSGASDTRREFGSGLESNVAGNRQRFTRYPGN